MSRKNNEKLAKKKLAKHKTYFYTGKISPVLRKKVNAACGKWGIHSRGFDVIGTTFHRKLVDNKSISQSDIVLGEIKCAASKSTIGFTLTQNQQHNGRTLGDNFKVIVYMADIDKMTIYPNVDIFLSETSSKQQSITGFMNTKKVIKRSF